MGRALSVLLVASAALVSVSGEEVRFTSVKALSDTKEVFLPREERFAVTGQVISIFHHEDKKRGNNRIVFLTDGTTSISVGDQSGELKYRRGDIVSMSGSIIRNAALDDEGMNAFRVNVVGHAPFPSAAAIDCDDVSPATTPPGFYAVKGVVTSVMRDESDVHWNWLAIRGRTRAVSIALTNEEYPYASLTNLVDAEVAVNGCYSPRRMFLLRQNISAVGTNGVCVTRPARADPFSAPSLGTGDPRHRQTAHGVVKAIGQRRLYLKADDGRLTTVHLTTPAGNVRPGDRVTVAGFPSLTRFDGQLAQAVARVDGRDCGAEESPEAISFRDLFSSPFGQHQVNHDHHGQLVRITGTVATTPGESRSSGLVRLREDGLTVEVLVSEIEAKCLEGVVEGCVIEATGICIVDFDDADLATALPVWRRTLILPRTAADIAVLSRPPWWTPPRLVAVIALLFALLGAAMAWNKALVKRARRHGEELFHEKIAHAKAEVKVEVRTRLAVELHDSISQTLTGIALQVDSAERANAGENGTVARFLGLARQMLGSCRLELQSCLLDLRNRTFEEKDLSEAIRRSVMPLSGNADIVVRFNVPREQLSDTTVHTILKIIRELVVNAIRHGGAPHVRIAGERKGDELRFSVRDDGCGFDAETAPGPMQGHFGLQGIRERTKEFGGSVEVESSAGRGTKVTVTMMTTRES